MQNVRRKYRRSNSVVVIMYATVPDNNSESSVNQGYSQCNCHPDWLIPPSIDSISPSKTPLQRELDINAKRTQMVSVPISHGKPDPRAWTAPLSNCFCPIEILNVERLNSSTIIMDGLEIESSICHNCGYMPGAWLPGLPCPECGEMLI